MEFLCRMGDRPIQLKLGLRVSLKISRIRDTGHFDSGIRRRGPLPETSPSVEETKLGSGTSRGPNYVSD